MRIVVALGGNALLERGETPDPRTEHARARAAARSLAPVAQHHNLVVCHGNGPQIGLLASQSQTDPHLARPYPLDVIGAQTQGMIGYCLAQELGSNAAGRDAVAIVTQTIIDPADDAFLDPTKYIGPMLSHREATELAAAHQWSIKPEAGGWRRVVPSPKPQAIVELPTIQLLLEHDKIVICAGGGGVPIRHNGALVSGVEAVIDKDATAALLAAELAADMLVILTDIDAVKIDYGSPGERSLNEVTVEELAALPFAQGSMGPKVAACLDFVSRTGKPAHIGALRDASAVIAGSAGTRVRPSADNDHGVGHGAAGVTA